jgi:ABC-type nitrate/sulfonate/bicarbonate transport system substrate-binding protein
MVGKKTAATILYEIALKRHGLKPNRNKYFTSGTGPSLVGSMASGATKVAASYEPYSASMERKDIGHILYTASDMLGFDEPGDGAVVRTKFAKQHPKAVVDVLRATFDATNIVKKDPSAAVKPVANFAKVDEATVKDIYSRKDLIPSSYVPHRKHIVKAAKLAQDAGFAPKGVNLPKFVKNKFVVTRYAKKASAEK